MDNPQKIDVNVTVQKPTSQVANTAGGCCGWIVLLVIILAIIGSISASCQGNNGYNGQGHVNIERAAW